MNQLQPFDGLAAEPGFDPKAYLQILRRRYLFLVVPALVVFAVAVWVARVLPPVYQATATILVESQQIPSSLAQSTVTANADERIQIIQQRLMTRDNLLTIARKYSLYSDQPGLSPTDIVAAMREATRIHQIDVGSRSAQAIGFTVSFQNEDANAAAKVANEFVTSILEQNIQSRTSRAAETSKFFDQQVSDLEKNLAAQEARIVDFKNANRGSLPETLASRQAILTQLENQAGELRNRIDGLQSQKELLQSQGDTALDPNANSTEGQLAQLRMQLVQMRAVYSDSHPEVRALTAKIAALEKASTAPPAGNADAGATTNDAPDGTVGPNAARIADVDNQLNGLNAQLGDLENKIADLTQSIQKTPEVEVALNVLMRDYSTLQTRYAAAQAKSAEASTGQQLEQDRQAERFEVLEQASVPPEPIKPNRSRIVLAGGFGSILAGVAVVMLMEALDQSIRGAADLERRLHVRPLVSIPYVTTNRERQRKKRFRFAMPAVAVLTASVLLVAVQAFYLPLDLVAQKVIQRLGF